MARLLVVDDDPAAREIVRLYLEDAHHSVVEAGDGGAALSALGQGGFDGIVLDISLGDMEGMAVLRRVRARPELRRLPIVMLSGHTSPETIEEARELGSSAYLTKPVEQEELLRVIDRLVPGGGTD